MGFFSSMCEGCDHPLLCAAATSEINGWMKEVVAIQPDGQIIIGHYNGYGSVVDDDEVEHDGAIIEATVWHLACWLKAGEQAEYRGESAHAPDQGWFFEAGAHDMPEPKGVATAKATVQRVEVIDMGQWPRLAEVLRYAERRGITVEEAIHELVNCGLSHQF